MQITMKKRLHFTVFITVLLFNSSSGNNKVVEVSGVAGHGARLPCDASSQYSDADSVTLVLWFRNDTDQPIYSYDLRKAGAGAAVWRAAALAGRSLFKAGPPALLQLRQLQAADAGFYRCRVDFKHAQTHFTDVKLQVIVPPERVTILNESNALVNEQELGPYPEGTLLHLTCVVIGGNPQPNVTWWQGDTELAARAVALSPRRQRASLAVRLQRAHAAAALTCRASNHVDVPPLAATVHIQMSLSPTLVNLYAGAGAGWPSGSQARLQCEVAGATPRPRVSWWRDALVLDIPQNETFTEENGGTMTSVVELEVTREDHGLNVTCCAGDAGGAGGAGDGSAPNSEDYCDSHVMNILYAPILTIQVNGSVVNETSVQDGGDLLLKCVIDANPSVTNVFWMFDNGTLENPEEDGALSCSTLLLTNISLANSGLYRCGATNAQGDALSAPLTMNVQYNPRCSVDKAEEFGVAPDGALNLTCNMDANPPPHLYTWRFINDTVTDTGVINDQEKKSELIYLLTTNKSDFEYTISEDFKYGSIFCTAQNTVGSDSLPCLFVISESSRPHPPHDCSLVFEGELIQVQCQPGHNGGLEQEFRLDLVSAESKATVFSKTPEFTAAVQERGIVYHITVTAFNGKGDSDPLHVSDLHIPISEAKQAALELRTLIFWLAGGVGLLVLVACGVVMTARERWGSDAGSAAGADDDRGTRYARRPRASVRPYSDDDPIYHCNESDLGSEISLRRSESFKRAMTPKCQIKSKETQRSSSLRFAKMQRDLIDSGHEIQTAYGTLRKCQLLESGYKHSGDCRMHSLQNVSGGGCRAAADLLCDHLLMHLPTDVSNYSVPKPPVPFCTLPRRNNFKPHSQVHMYEPSKFNIDTSTLPLPLPPEELCGSQLPAPDMNSQQYNNNVIISSMNTVGLLTEDTPHRSETIHNSPFEDDDSAHFSQINHSQGLKF